MCTWPTVAVPSTTFVWSPRDLAAGPRSQDLELRRIAPTLLFTACSPFQGVAWWVDEPGSDGVRPTIEVVRPVAGEVYAEGETLLAEAVLGHPVDDVVSLTVTLLQGDESVEGWMLDDDGTWTWEITVGGVLGAATLQVADSDGDSASAALSWSGNRAPEVSIQAPADDDRFFAGEPIPTLATVTDPDVSDPRLLDARWELEGSTVTSGSPDAEGQVALNLPAQPVGTHTFTLIGSDGVIETSAEVTVHVDPPPDTGDTGTD